MIFCDISHLNLLWRFQHGGIIKIWFLRYFSLYSSKDPFMSREASLYLGRLCFVVSGECVSWKIILCLERRSCVSKNYVRIWRLIYVLFWFNYPISKTVYYINLRNISPNELYWRVKASEISVLARWSSFLRGYLLR